MKPHPPIVLAVGVRLRALRVGRGMTLKEVAAVTGTSLGYLSQLERGLNAAALETYRRAAAAVGVTLSELFSQAEQLLTEEDS